MAQPTLSLPRAWPSRLDLAIAAVAAGLDIALFTQLSDATDQTGWAGRGTPPAVIVVAGLVVVPVLWWRRRAPALVCLLVAAHAVIVTGLLGSRPLVAVLVALYTAAVWCSRRWAWLCLAAVLAAHAVAVGYEASFAGPAGLAIVAVALFYGLVDISTWSAGRWGASFSARSNARKLEESRAALAASAVDAERLRIAHELHDTVAHAITVMVLQSAGAHRLADRNPPVAQDAMRSVEAVGTQAIAELRRLLAVLRAGVDTADPPLEVVSDDRTLSGLDTLAAQVRACGIQVRTELHGSPGQLDPSVDLTAYRVVQEALTNVAKHAGAGATAVVTVDWAPSELVVEVVNDRSAPTGSLGARMPSGYGLVGLAERVKLVGGQLSSGPDHRGGYAVRASLPVSCTAIATSEPLFS